MNIDILNTYWRDVNNISQRIQKELPSLKEDKTTKIGKHLSVINYSDIGDTWSVKSTTLDALSSKISHMIIKGDACNVQPMLKRMIQKGIKKQSHPVGKFKKQQNRELGFVRYKAEFLGYGHFRWNNQSYVLSTFELDVIKSYFGIQ